MVVVVLMTVVTALALFTNLAIVLIVIKISQLRYTLTNVFVINLCVADILGALIILPICIIVFVEGYWPWNHEFCIATGFLNSLFIFASILNICVISVERYYAINSPMHHAGHMTLKKTLAVVFSIWLFSAFLSALPIMGWNSYNYYHTKAQCTYNWVAKGQGKVYVLVITFIGFIIPGCIIVIMYTAIIRIARLVAVQVRPSSSTTRRVSTNRVSLQSCGGTSLGPDSRSVDSRRVIENAPVFKSSTAFQRNTSARHLRGLKTPLIVLVVYVSLWGPYFFVQLLTATGVKETNANWEIAVIWLGYMSFAANPFLYGWMNKSIRDQLINLIKSSWCCFKDEELGPDSDSIEDIFRIMDRTSCRE